MRLRIFVHCPSIIIYYIIIIFLHIFTYIICLTFFIFSVLFLCLLSRTTYRTSERAMILLPTLRAPFELQSLKYNTSRTRYSVFCAFDWPRSHDFPRQIVPFSADLGEKIDLFCRRMR